MSSYAIGDIQGCYDPLRRLLDRVEFDPHEDQLYLLGDLVNRGPQSLEVVRFVRSLGARAVTVLGNHDLHFLAVALDARPESKGDSLSELLRAPESSEMVEWFRALPVAHQADAPGGPWLMVHAGILPSWTPQQCLRFARELEAVIRGPDCLAYLKSMYGNQPLRFDPASKGMPRYRALTNIFTRMRFCALDGTLDLTTKGPANAAPAGMLPWFAHPTRQSRNVQLLFGHWAALQGETHEPNVHALDTGCVWGNRLTALRLEDGQRFCSNC